MCLQIWFTMELFPIGIDILRISLQPDEPIFLITHMVLSRSCYFRSFLLCNLLPTLILSCDFNMDMSCIRLLQMYV